MRSQNRKKVSEAASADAKASESSGKKPSRRPNPVTQFGKPGTDVQPESRPAKSDIRNNFPIVGVGASAGGLEAFTQLLKHLPADTGMGFVLVQHLDPQHESALTQILARATSMSLREVTNNLRVEANHVYVIPPNTSLTIEQGVLKLGPRQDGRKPHRSIDSFFESLAQDQRERAISSSGRRTLPRNSPALRSIRMSRVKLLNSPPRKKTEPPRQYMRMMKLRCHQGDAGVQIRERSRRAPKPKGRRPKREKMDSKKSFSFFATIPAWISRSTNPPPSSGALPGAWC